jgi:hypothetical protein
MMTRVKILPFAIAITSVVGCGSTTLSSDDAGSDATTGPTAEAACADLAGVQCAKRMTCSNGGNVQRTFGTMATCVARETTACMNGLAAPQSGNSPTTVEACVAAYATYSCADFFDNVPPSSCVPKGARADGQPCTFNAQCAGGFCSGNKTAVCGTCAAPPAAGSSCASSNCWRGQGCVAATQLCEPNGTLNGSCDANDPCGNGLSCVGAVVATSTPGTCSTAVGQLGSACGGTLPGCYGTLGLFCGGAAGARTCMAITFVGDGMACGNLSTTSRAQCIAGDCYTTAGLAGANEVGLCKADAADGAACDTVLGPGCAVPARCVTTGTGSAGTCTLPTGAACG